MSTNRPIVWPDGKAFAFTVFDDTDLATVDNVGPVYALIRDLGLRTTKSVWPIQAPGTPRIGGDTCEDPRYLAWVRSLQADGFEIGYHGASNVTAPREEAGRALERFRELFGHYPMAMANHSGCFESIYWGSARASGLGRLAYDVMTRFQRRHMFRGHLEGDPLFWGDLCQAKVRYVRNFTYTDIDTLRACPQMPYHDPDRPYVNAWFASSEGADVTAFNRCISEAHQDRLEASGGACIMYTHFASGFLAGGRPDPRFVELITRLAGKNGWFVPVTTLLDFLAARNDDQTLSAGQRRTLERRWLLSKLRVGYS